MGGERRTENGEGQKADAAASSRESPWGEYPIDPGNTELVDLGPLRLWWKTQDGDFWMARRNPADNDSPPEPDGPPGHEGWTRLPLEDQFRAVRLSPCFPDRPVVVQPETALVVPPGGNLPVFIRCPLWAEVALLGKGELAVAEVPSVVLSNTWFGSFTEGELCYWISSSASRSIRPKSEPYLAVCPVDIRNHSEEDLEVERICLRVMNLTLYLSEGRLWSDVMEAHYRGGPEISEVQATGKAPSQAARAKKVRRPRQPLKAPLVARTFRSLRTGLGLLGEE